MPRHKTLHDSPDDAEHAFYDALERADLDGMMDLWSDEEEIVCIHPGGIRLTGHAAIRSAWQAMFANGPVHARPSQVQSVRGPMVSVHSLVEQVIVSGPGPTGVVSVFATNVYFKGTQGWRLVLHHSSLTPDEHTAPAVTRPAVLH